MEKHDTTHQSWSASVQYLINGGPCYHGNVYHTNEGYVGQRVTATTVRLFMYGSFGATGISPSNMMHILSDEEKQRWKSLQAVDYCLWVFVFGKESFSTVYGRSSHSLMCCLFFFFFVFQILVGQVCQHLALCTRDCLYPWTQLSQFPLILTSKPAVDNLKTWPGNFKPTC